MTAPTLFIAAAAALLVVVLAVLLRPCWRAPAAARATDRRAANLALLREQRAELERERDEGLLAAADFAQARSELQRRLLAELPPESPESPPPAPGGGRATALALLVALPLAALAGYLLLGSPQALDPQRTQARVSPQQIEQMLGRLAARLQTQPDDAAGWVMLARSYKALGRYAEAGDAYSHGGALVDADAALLADYAEVAARASGRLDGLSAELVARALKLDADEPQALLLAGAAASERNDFAAVARHWGRLLRQVDPASEEGKSLAAAVAKARRSAAEAHQAPSARRGD